MTNFTTPPAPMAPQPAVADPPPISRNEFAQLLARVTRTETRLTRLLEHHGLDTHGRPIAPKETH